MVEVLPRRVRRLHAGDIRILYEVDDQAATVYIINIGIIA